MLPTPSSSSSNPLCRRPIHQEGVFHACSGGWEIPHCMDAGTLSGAAPWQERGASA